MLKKKVIRLVPEKVTLEECDLIRCQWRDDVHLHFRAKCLNLPVMDKVAVRRYLEFCWSTNSITEAECDAALQVTERIPLDLLKDKDDQLRQAG